MDGCTIMQRIDLENITSFRKRKKKGLKETNLWNSFDALGIQSRWTNQSWILSECGEFFGKGILALLLTRFLSLESKVFKQFTDARWKTHAETTAANTDSSGDDLNSQCYIHCDAKIYEGVARWQLGTLILIEKKWKK